MFPVAFILSVCVRVCVYVCVVRQTEPEGMTKVK